MKKTKTHFALNEPLRHSHKPVSRRGFIAQGFRAGTATMLGASMLPFLGERAHALSAANFAGGSLTENCDLGNSGVGKIPFICFDLAGGANFSGSNVLVGGAAGQLDFLTTAGYSKLGLPSDMIPSLDGMVNNQFGLAFHSDSAMLRGMLASAPSVATQSGTNGAVMPARSDNDTVSNTHNPSYGIYNAGARGNLLQLIGSRNSVSGANSLAPALMIDPEVLPTKVDRASDVTGLVDVGDLSALFQAPADVVAVMESIKNITDMKLNVVDTGMGAAVDTQLKERVSCEYLKSADSYEKFSDPSELNPALDSNIVGSIFTADEFNNDREFQKTASVMKMVINGYAAAGSITMGGYDYHTGDRRTGEARDLRAGRCIGACLEYAQRVNKPVMIYVYSDGSVASNGTLDTTTSTNYPNPKGVWTGDNSSTASSFFLVYNPGGRPVLSTSAGKTAEQHQQLGYMDETASVVTSSGYSFANSPDLLAQTVVLNYMALHGASGVSDFDSPGSIFPPSGASNMHGLGSSDLDKYVAFEPIL